MRGFRHQHTSDLSASLTCSTMAFDFERLESQTGLQQLPPFLGNENEQNLDSSVKILLMKLLVKGLLSGDNFDGVISLGQELLNQAPRSIYLHYALGTAFSKIGDNEKAAYHCNLFLEIDPITEDAPFKNENLATVHNNLAVCLKNRGLLEQAESHFKNALKCDDNFAAAHNNYGNLLNDRADIAAARKCFLRAIEINPDDHIAYWNLHSTAGSIEEAELIIEACIERSKSDEMAVFTLAGLRAFSGDRSGLDELKSFGFASEPLIRSVDWVLGLPDLPKIHFNRWAVFDEAIALADRTRAFYEFGVWMGDSFRYLVPHFSVGLGFDSFKGLPEDWGVVPKGTYSSLGIVPNIANSNFIVGEFAETLPSYFLEKRPKAGLINFDADLYSSTICALRNARNVIDPRTVLVFDEFLVNNDWEKDELKALEEFCAEFGFSYKVEAISLFTKQMACRLLPLT